MLENQGLLKSELLIRTNSRIKVKTKSITTPVLNPEIKSNSYFSLLPFKVQAGLIIREAEAVNLLEEIDNNNSDLTNYIDQFKELTESFRFKLHGPDFSKAIREHWGMEESHERVRVDATPSGKPGLHLDLLLARIIASADNELVQEKLKNNNLKITDMKNLLDARFSILFGDNWMKGRKDYIEGFLSDKYGIEYLNQHQMRPYQISQLLDTLDTFLLNQNKDRKDDPLSEDFINSHEESLEILQIFIKSPDIHKKKKQENLRNIEKSLLFIAIVGGWLGPWTSAGTSKGSNDLIDRYRAGRTEMLDNLRQGNQLSAGLDCDYHSTVNSPDFLNHHIPGFIGTSDDKYDEGYAGSCMFAFLKDIMNDLEESNQKRLDEILYKHLGDKEQNNDTYLNKLLLIDRADLIDEFFVKSNNKEISQYTYTDLLLFPKLTERTRDKIMDNLLEDPLFNKSSQLKAKFDIEIFDFILSKDNGLYKTDKKSKNDLAQELLEKLNLDQVSALNLDTAPWGYKEIVKGKEERLECSDLTFLAKIFKKYDLAEEKIKSITEKVLQRDIEKLKTGEINLNEIANLTKTIQDLELESDYVALIQDIWNTISSTNPEFNCAKFFIFSHDEEAKKDKDYYRISDTKWNFDFFKETIVKRLDKFFDGYESYSLAQDNFGDRTYRYFNKILKHGEIIKRDLEHAHKNKNLDKLSEIDTEDPEFQRAFKVLGNSFLRADTTETLNVYTPILYLLDGISDELKDKIEQNFQEFSMVQKADFLCKLQEYGLKSKTAKSNYLKLEESLIKDIHNSADMNSIVNYLNESNFKYSHMFRLKLMSRYKKNDNFIWHCSSNNKEKFTSSFPSIWNTGFIDKLPICKQDMKEVDSQDGFKSLQMYINEKPEPILEYKFNQQNNYFEIKSCVQYGDLARIQFHGPKQVWHSVDKLYDKNIVRVNNNLYFVARKANNDADFIPVDSENFQKLIDVLGDDELNDKLEELKKITREYSFEFNTGTKPKHLHQSRGPALVDHIALLIDNNFRNPIKFLDSCNKAIETNNLKELSQLLKRAAEFEIKVDMKELAKKIQTSQIVENSSYSLSYREMRDSMKEGLVLPVERDLPMLIFNKTIDAIYSLHDLNEFHDDFYNKLCSLNEVYNSIYDYHNSNYQDHFSSETHPLEYSTSCL